jgi:hypothetical protein
MLPRQKKKIEFCRKKKLSCNNRTSIHHINHDLELENIGIELDLQMRHGISERGTCWFHICQGSYKIRKKMPPLKTCKYQQILPLQSFFKSLVTKIFTKLPCTAKEISTGQHPFNCQYVVVSVTAPA